jgi:hypothetical protein
MLSYPCKFAANRCEYIQLFNIQTATAGKSQVLAIQITHNEVTRHAQQVQVHSRSI